MTGWQEAVKEWTIILGLSFTALRGILQFCLKSSPDKLLKSHSEIKSHTQRIISGQQSSMGLYQTPTNSHISSFCNHQKTCVGWSISPLWFIAQLSREQEMTNPKISIFYPCCPVEQNVPCRIYPASHGSLDSFQRLSILKYQRLCDFFFLCVYENDDEKHLSQYSIIFPVASECLDTISDSSPLPGLLLQAHSKQNEGSRSTTGKAAFQNVVWSRLISVL